MWGKAKGENTMSFDALEPWGKDDHSGECGPDCKFRGKEEDGTTQGQSEPISKEEEGEEGCRTVGKIKENVTTER